MFKDLRVLPQELMENQKEMKVEHEMEARVCIRLI